jgi:hypothetical protein
VWLLDVRGFERKIEGPPSACPGKNSHGISRISIRSLLKSFK